MFRRGKLFSDRGQSAVEFALVVPIFLALVLWMISIGFQFYSAVVVSNAAREAARHAAIHGIQGNENIFYEVVESALKPIIPRSDTFSVHDSVTVTWKVGSAEYTENQFISLGNEDAWVIARIYYDYKPMFGMGVINRLLFASSNDENTLLYGEAIFRNERFLQ